MSAEDDEKRLTAWSEGFAKAVAKTIIRLPQKHREAIGDTLGSMSAIILAELRETNRRLAALESDDRYKGVWQSSQKYRRGDYCTFDGSLWHCNRDTTLRPGSNANTDWQLAVKKAG